MPCGGGTPGRLADRLAGESVTQNSLSVSLASCLCVAVYHFLITVRTPNEADAMQSWIITAVGPDRPGLVGELTGHLLAAQANIADSRMVNLQGRFVLLLLVQVADDKAQALQQILHDAGPKIGLTISLASPSGESAGEARSPRGGLPYVLRTASMDQPGIVHRLTHLLHQHGINIEELQTRLEPGQVSGTPLFSMDMRLTVPPTVKISQLRQSLTTLCDSLNCDVELQSA